MRRLPQMTIAAVMYLIHCPRTPFKVQKPCFEPAYARFMVIVDIIKANQGCWAHIDRFFLYSYEMNYNNNYVLLYLSKTTRLHHRDNTKGNEKKNDYPKTKNIKTNNIKLKLPDSLLDSVHITLDIK